LEWWWFEAGPAVHIIDDWSSIGKIPQRQIKKHFLPPGIFQVDFGLLGQMPMIGVERGKQMKTLKSVISVVVLCGAMCSNVALAAGAEVIAKDLVTENSYCHIKFAAIREETLGTTHPALKDAGLGDIIDYYGPCSHDPLGKDEIQAQLLQLQHRRSHDYMN
jgi:hypothetical protein